MGQQHVGQERRRFYRVQDEISLEYKPVDKDTASHGDPLKQFPDAGELSLFTEFRRLDAEAEQTLHAIGEQNRQVADYLRTLNHKIELLSQALVAEHQPKTDEEITHISLSEDGIGFECDKPLYRGSFVALRLLFLPAYVGVVAFGEVIRCTLSDQRHMIAIKFHRLNDQQRRLLNKQIMQVQIQAKRDNQGRN